MFYFSTYLPFTFLPIAFVGLYFLFESHFANKKIRWLWWMVCLFIVLCIGYFAIQEHALYDFFKGYYYGGRKILRNPEVLYDESCYNYVNFPLFAYLFIPLANLPKEIAGRIYFMLGYAALLPLAYWLVIAFGLKGWKRFLMLGLLFINGPLDYNIWLGNSTQIVMLLVILALWGLKGGWDWLSGLLLGTAGLIKLPLILPSGYFFVRSKWKVVAGGLLLAGIVLFLSLTLIPAPLNTVWLDRCILSMARNPIGAYNNQSLNGFLARIFMPGNLGWDPLVPSSAYELTARIGTLIFYVPAIFVLFFGRRYPNMTSRHILEFLIIMMCSLLTSPIAWTHYFVLLLIPIAWYLSEEHFHIHRTGLHVFVLVAALFISIPKDLSLALFEKTGMTVFLSPQFLGGILLYMVFLTLWWLLGKAEKPNSVI